MQMRYRRFGRTNLEMPVFSCGGMRYQQSWDDITPNAVEEAGQHNLEATILRALELGITHIETARGYGSSEMQLGWILPRLPREKMIVQTKIAPFATAGEFRTTFEKSLTLLKLGHVDLLSLHGVNNAELLDWSLRKGGCLAEARKLQREGRCRFVGFSTHATTAIIRRAIEDGDFDYVNLHWYFVNETNWPAVQSAAARDMGVFIISPNDKGGKLYAPPQRLRELCAPLSPMQWNDLWCLAHPQVHTLSLGAARPEDFEEHVAGLAHYDRAVEITAPGEGRLRAEMNGALGAEWCAHWPEGLPDYTDVPGSVNVQEIVRLYTYARSLGLIDWAKMRYNLLGGAGGHWFPGEMAVDFDDDAIRRACERSPFAAEIPRVLREAHALLHDTPKKRLSQGGG
jgi:predicted aldo/keto reductase-like oxidoreductase